MPTFRTADGAELYYKVEGNERGNPSLIFIHGWCSNLNHWEQQVRYFQDSYRILRMDRRGMGKSTTPGTGHTPEQHAADIAALARHEGFTNAVAIAHAGGGPAGVYLCSGYPDLVSAYVMVDTAITPGFDLDDTTKMPARLYAEMIEKMTAPDGERYFRELYTSFFGAQADRELVESAVAEASRTPVETRVKEIKLMATDTATPAGTMRQPTLVIAGPWLADSFPQAVDDARLKAFFKQAQRVELARAIGTGHFVQLEVPDQTNAFIKSFVSRSA
ncbi:MAG: alpha/beta fold hydrolase [Candidatus Binatia bacterium]